SQREPAPPTVKNHVTTVAPSRKIRTPENRAGNHAGPSLGSIEEPRRRQGVALPSRISGRRGTTSPSQADYTPQGADACRTRVGYSGIKLESTYGGQSRIPFLYQSGSDQYSRPRLAGDGSRRHRL